MNRLRWCMVIVVMSLLVVGSLVVQEMDTRTGDDGRVEEIERAREAAGQAEEAMDTTPAEPETGRLSGITTCLLG